MKIAQKRRKLSALPTQTQHKWFKYIQILLVNAHFEPVIQLF